MSFDTIKHNLVFIYLKSALRITLLNHIITKNSPSQCVQKVDYTIHWINHQLADRVKVSKETVELCRWE